VTGHTDSEWGCHTALRDIRTIIKGEYVGRPLKAEGGAGKRVALTPLPNLLTIYQHELMEIRKGIGYPHFTHKAYPFRSTQGEAGKR